MVKVVIGCIEHEFNLFWVKKIYSDFQIFWIFWSKSEISGIFCLFLAKEIFFSIFTNDINFHLWDHLDTIFRNKTQQTIFEYVK